jgi:hypothetical protein
MSFMKDSASSLSSMVVATKDRGVTEADAECDGIASYATSLETNLQVCTMLAYHVIFWLACILLSSILHCSFFLGSTHHRGCPGAQEQGEGITHHSCNAILTPS